MKLMFYNDKKCMNVQIGHHRLTFNKWGNSLLISVLNFELKITFSSAIVKHLQRFYKWPKHFVTWDNGIIEPAYHCEIKLWSTKAEFIDNKDVNDGA